MQRTKGIKTHNFLLILVLFLSVACIAYHYSIFGGSSLPGQRSFLTNSEALACTSLECMLKMACTGKKVVIVVILNYAWAKPNSLFDLFLESLHVGNQTKQLLRHVVVVTVDEKAYERCISMHPHCYMFRVEGMANPWVHKRYSSEDYLKLMWRRIDLLRTILELGYSFIFTDVDVMWVRNPIPVLESMDGDMAMSCDVYYGDPVDYRSYVNGGFQYARANNRTVWFYGHWFNSWKAFPKNLTQDAFDAIKLDEHVDDMEVEIRYLDTARFKGFCNPGRVNWSKIVTLHANCVGNYQEKHHGLKVFLANWVSYVANSLPSTSPGKPT